MYFAKHAHSKFTSKCAKNLKTKYNMVTKGLLLKIIVSTMIIVALYVLIRLKPLERLYYRIVSEFKFRVLKNKLPRDFLRDSFYDKV